VINVKCIAHSGFSLVAFRTYFFFSRSLVQRRPAPHRSLLSSPALSLLPVSKPPLRTLRRRLAFPSAFLVIIWEIVTELESRVTSLPPTGGVNRRRSYPPYYLSRAVVCVPSHRGLPYPEAYYSGWYLTAEIRPPRPLLSSCSFLFPRYRAMVLASSWRRSWPTLLLLGEAMAVEILCFPRVLSLFYRIRTYR